MNVFTYIGAGVVVGALVGLIMGLVGAPPAWLVGAIAGVVGSITGWLVVQRIEAAAVDSYRARQPEDDDA